MATQAEVQAYSTAINDISTVLYGQLRALLLSLDDPNPITFRDALLRFYPELLRPFLNAANDVAAVWYTELRRQSLAGSVRPVVAALPALEQMEAGVRYALTPLFQPQATDSGARVLSSLAGFSQRLVADQGRNSIRFNATTDRVRVGFQRVPQPGCCAFCGLMASRGATYSSRESAGESRKFHNYCRCVVVPVFPGGDNGFLTDTQKQFEALYSQAASGDLKSTLAEWRKVHGTN